MDRHRFEKMTFIFKNVTSQNQEWFQIFKTKMNMQSRLFSASCSRANSSQEIILSSFINYTNSSTPPICRHFRSITFGKTNNMRLTSNNNIKIKTLVYMEDSEVEELASTFRRFLKYDYIDIPHKYLVRFMFYLEELEFNLDYNHIITDKLAYLYSHPYLQEFRRRTRDLIMQKAIDHVLMDKCKICNRPEESSGEFIKAIAGNAYGMYNAFKFNSDTIDQIISRWVTNLAILAFNPNVPTIILSFLNLINEFVPLSSLLPQVCKLFNTAVNHMMQCVKDLTQFVSQQPTTDTYAEESSGIFDEMELLIDLNKFKSTAPVLGAAMGSIFVIFATVISGTHVTENKKDGMVKRAAESLYTLARGKSGIYAIIDMVKDTYKFIFNMVTEIISGPQDTYLNNLIRTSNCLETENCKKSEFFEYLDYVLDPRNTNTLTINKIYQERLDFCTKILDEISEQFAQVDHTTNYNTLRFISGKLIELKKIRAFVYAHPQTEFTRPTPMWINLVGASGTGKSQFTSLLGLTMMEVLKKTKIHAELPSRDRWMFSVNFTDKFLTGYRQQYICTIDDLFQDKAPLGDRSSALDIISWVSNIPHHTNQAGLLEKGVLFESRIIISSSNDFHMQRPEITSPEALKRRMNIFAHFITDDNMDKPDPLLGQKVRIKATKFVARIDSSGNRTFVEQIIGMYTAMEFITLCAQKYLEWHDHQDYLLKTRTPQQEFIDNIAEELFKDKPEYKAQKKKPGEEATIPKELIVESSGLYCALFTPKLVDKDIQVHNFILEQEETITISQYDCDCEKHERLNVNYQAYVSMVQYNQCQFMSLAAFADYESPTILTILAESYRTATDKIFGKIEQLMKSTIWKIIFGGLAALGTALLTFSIFKGAKANNEIEELDTTAFESKVKYQVTKPYRATPKRVVITESSGLEMNYFGKDMQSEHFIIETLIAKGSQCMIVHPESKRVNVALRVHGTCLLTNHHYFKYFKEGDKFEIHIKTKTLPSSVCMQQFNSNHLHRIGDTDLVVYKCDTSLGRSKSLVKHFPDEEVVIQQHEAVISTVFPVPSIVRGVTATPITYKLEYGSNGTTYDLLNSYITNVPSSKGYSGSLLIALDPKIKNKILGVQVAIGGSSKLGYFKPVTKNQILNALECLDDAYEFHTQIDKAVEECSAVLMPNKPKPPNLGNNSLQYHGVVAKKAIMLTQSNTKIEPSLIHNADKITREPSVLSDYDVRMKEEFIGKSIMFRSFEGFDSPIGSINTRILNQAVEDLALYYKIKLNDVNIPPVILDDYQMVNGIPIYLKRLEMKSSPGYPYVKQRKLTTLTGKYEWFTKMADSELREGYSLAYQMTPELESGVKRRFKLAKQGINDLTVAYACLKDETRPIAKVEEGKTRTFICLPMDYNLLVRKLFGAFIAAQHAHAVDIPSCVGVDPAKDWRKIYDKLRNKSFKWEDYDYKNWDQHLHPELIIRVADIVNRWYGDSNDSEHGIARRVLLYDLIHTNIIVKDRLFTKSTGQCSGCAITAELNCLVHDLLMYYTWLLIHKQLKRITSLDEYRTHVATVLYGDDIVKANNPDYDVLFFGNQIKPVMEELGMGITPGDKTSTTFDLKPPDQITFLKRTFVRESDAVKAPLDKDIIENIFQWINKSDDPVEATRINCEMALQESFMHGRIYFNNLREEINDRIQKFNLGHGKYIEPIVLSYDAFEEKYNNEDFVCIGME
uniref:Uncharacterized protein n=1 Tax=Picornavirales sp. TaxID=1955153 RepID=A0A6M9Z7F3_9VIRU|nr:MAG: hypothetical protein 2 [Picornavirales sp.]